MLASEVRKLTQHSAADIKVLTVEKVDTVASGENTAGISSGHIDNICGEVSQISSMLNEIHHTTEEQTAALTLINRSVEQVKLMTQDNSTMVAQSTSSTQALMSRTPDFRMPHPLTV
ncbi:TPA: hypothetical protein ACKE1S_000717 [Citrobacter farmeri]